MLRVLSSLASLIAVTPMLWDAELSFPRQEVLDAVRNASVRDARHDIFPVGASATRCDGAQQEPPKALTLVAALPGALRRGRGQYERASGKGE